MPVIPNFHFTYGNVLWGSVNITWDAANYFPIVNCLQLLENIQTSVSEIKESLITHFDASNLERRLEVLEGQAAENQFDLVRKS